MASSGYVPVINVEASHTANWGDSDREIEPFISVQVILEIEKDFDAIRVDPTTKRTLREGYFKLIVNQLKNLRIDAVSNSVMTEISETKETREITGSDPDVYFNFLQDIENKRKAIHIQFGKTLSWSANKSINQAFDNVLKRILDHVKKSQPAFTKLCQSYLREPKAKIRRARWSQIKAGCGIAACSLWTPIQCTLTCCNACGTGSCRRCCDSTFVGQKGVTRLSDNTFEMYNEKELKDGETNECAPRNSIISLWDNVKTAQEMIAEENRKLQTLGPTVQKMA